jgi:hypothetical protein
MSGFHRLQIDSSSITQAAQPWSKGHAFFFFWYAIFSLMRIKS